MIRHAHRLLPLLSLVVLGCSSDGGGSPVSQPVTDGNWTTLASADWTLAPGSEAPDWCVKIPITEDTYISAIRPVHPKGTHHTFVAVSDTADGERCTAAVGTGTLIYAAALGTKELRLPEGVAMKLPAGKVLNLSLHLYNPSSQELSGTSGMEIVKMDAADVKFESGTLLAGPLDITIPPARTTTISHLCEVQNETTAFSLFPHMHQLGRHLKTTITVAGETTVLHDAAFDFSEQLQLPLDPVHFSPGDRIATECTYENASDKTVTFGESSDTEMCFSAFFTYPAEKFCATVKP